MEMFPDDVTIKLHAASYDEDPEFSDVEDEMDLIDEEEEETLSDDVGVEVHSEQAEIFAAPSTPAEPYEPPTKLSAEPVPAPPAPKKATPKKAAKKTVKKAVKKA